ncbi:MAG: hypothetical protein JWM11_1908 [Planctomycetaceae bacterium]|nr:hypothetical protein [Planctomycetaceae bacterium]
MRAFISRTYSRDDARTTEQIVTDLRQLDPKVQGWDTVEKRVGEEVSALLASVFNGQQIPAGTAFGELSPQQQEALCIIQEVCNEWWCVGNVMRRPLASYGFDFYEEQFKEFLAGERVSQ